MAGRLPNGLTFFFLLSITLLLATRVASAQSGAIDRDAYYRAVSYCRSSSLGDGIAAAVNPIMLGRQMSLSSDKQMRCFNGVITKDLDVALANDLKYGGLFIVRSMGGYAIPAIALSNIIRDRHATVVVYDYCVSACAGFFLVASELTYVLKDTLVAWHYPQGDELCTFLTVPYGDEERKVQRGPCQVGGEDGFSNSQSIVEFFAKRAVSPPISFPPDSLYVRKVVRNLYKETGRYRDAIWTLHPRYYPRLFKTKIVYEAYPESQGEVDAIIMRLPLNMSPDVRVIYDP